MPRNLVAEFLAHLRGNSTTLAIGIRLDRPDGLAMGFTTLPKRTLIDGLVYRPRTAITPTSVESRTSSGIDNNQFAGILRSDEITELDVLAGRFDHSRIQIFLFNYKDLTMGKIRLVRGRLGEVETDGQFGFKAEIRGLMQQASQTIVELTTAQCRVQRFADYRCGLSRPEHTFAGSVGTVLNNRTFRSPHLVGLRPDSWFDFGEFGFTSGPNAGATIPDVKTYVSSLGQIELQFRPRLAMSPGDAFYVVTGCSRLFPRCKELGNTINFQGEPYVPGPDIVFTISGK